MKVLFTGWEVGMQKVSVTKLFISHGGLQPAQAHALTSKILECNEDGFEHEFPVIIDSRDFIDSLRSFGVNFEIKDK